MGTGGKDRERFRRVLGTSFDGTVSLPVDADAGRLHQFLHSDVVRRIDSLTRRIYPSLLADSQL